MRQKKLSSLLLTATDGLIGTVIDASLLLFYLYGAAPFAGSGSKGVNRMFHDAERSLGKINYQTIKRTIHNLVGKKYIIRSKKRSSLEIQITKMGKDRINALFPVYRTTRPWDGYLYLISYDIPAKNNTVRNLLRTYLRRMGCALLQESLFMTPYAPHDIVNEFTGTHQINHTILVSKLGNDGAIGEESREDLISRVYHLPDLVKRYEDFIRNYESEKNPSRIALTLDYFSILKSDPQLPFRLLPKNFPGQKAFDIFRSHIHPNYYI